MRHLSTIAYRGYTLEMVETDGGNKFVRVKDGETILAGFRETGDGLDAINRACEWVEAQERAG